jgi:hypothetical protein
VTARTLYPDSMKIRSRGRASLGSLALVLACTGIALGALRSRAAEGCPTATCAPEEVSCRAAAALCELKIRAFEMYMGQIDTGRPKYALPQVYQEVLRPHYPLADLAQVRFAFSDQQPADNATTDCNDIYFNDASFVDTLRHAGPNPKLVWLLHELAHPEQCSAARGRAGYAKRWWDELEAAVRASGETIDVFQSTDQLAKQLRRLYARVHGMMPMEQAADAKAAAVLADLRQCCLTADGTLQRPDPDAR